MKELTKKILESGIVDEATAEMMEHWGYLEPGAAELAKKATLRDATREQLMKFGEELGEELEKERKLKETMLDLNQLRWPVQVGVWNNRSDESSRVLRVTALVDRMGRYYFRPADVPKDALVPGFVVMSGYEDMKKETILEVSELYVGDQVAAIQVSVG